MEPMRCRAALALLLALALGACTKDDPRMPSACTVTDRAGNERALAAAPRPVRLPGGVAISTCARRVRSDAELQDLGAVLHGVAEDLAGRARAGDVAAARSLGYLNAAVASGSGEYGIAAELSRRIGTAGVGLRDGSVAVARALDDGAAAGRARG
jgi:hypothetical protein